VVVTDEAVVSSALAHFCSEQDGFHDIEAGKCEQMFDQKRKMQCRSAVTGQSARERT
jgi:hypothetical protein